MTASGHGLLPLVRANPSSPRHVGPWIARCRCGWLDGLGGQHWTQAQARAAYKRHRDEARNR